MKLFDEQAQTNDEGLALQVEVGQFLRGIIKRYPGLPVLLELENLFNDTVHHTMIEIRLQRRYELQKIRERQTNETIEDYITDVYRAKGKIAAIKVYKAYTGCTLFHAKSFVENLCGERA